MLIAKIKTVMAKDEKQQALGFQMSLPDEKAADSELEELLELAEDFSELQRKVSDMLSDVEQEKEKSELYKKLEDIEKLLSNLQHPQESKISWLREKAVEIVVGAILLLMSGFILVQINHTRDIAGQNQTDIGVANARLEASASKEELAELRAELNASLGELRVEFVTINRNLQALVERPE